MVTANDCVLTVRWSRGPVQIDDYHKGDAPTGHHRFENAKLVNGQWEWQQILDCGIRQTQAYAKDVLWHLRSWDIMAHYDIRQNGRLIESC